MDTREAVEIAGKTRLSNEKFLSEEEQRKRGAVLANLMTEGKLKTGLLDLTSAQDQEKLKLANQLAMPETQAKISQYAAETDRARAIANEARGLFGSKMDLLSSQANEARSSAARTGADASRISFETERDKARSDLMTPDVLKQILSSNTGIPDLFGTRASTAVGSSNDTLAGLNSNPTARPSQMTTLTPAPTSAVSGSQQPYTDAYMNFSKSPLGLPLTAPNALLQNVTFPLFEGIGSGVSNAAKWLTSPIETKKKKALPLLPY